jgi:hypothetical protein
MVDLVKNIARGRPSKSRIRQNIIEILFYLGEGYGYQLSKLYQEIFSQVTQRSIYYQLRKGLQTKEIAIHEIKKELGDISWATSVEKVVYTLGPDADPKGSTRIKEYIEHWKKSQKLL